MVERLEDRTLLTAYIVDTLADAVAADGQVSLREAVLAANTNTAVNEAAAGQGGGLTDTITFASSVSGGTITLAGPELAIGDHLAVYGPVTISGNDATRVFSVAAGTAVTLNGLTVTHGGKVLYGAGLYNSGTLNLTGCVFSANAALEFAQGAIAAGGALYNAAGASATATDCAVSGNLSFYGAAVFDAGGALAVSASTFAGNYDHFRLNSGAVHAVGTATISGCLFSGNTDGLYNAGTMSVTGSSFASNAGVGIINAGGMVLASTSVTGNGFNGVINGGTLTSSSARITGNQGSGLRNTGTAYLAGAVIDGNGWLAPSYGFNAVQPSGPTRFGGGVYNVSKGVLTLDGCTVTSNAAVYGGGLYNEPGAVAALAGCLVTGNGVAAMGTPAGVHVYDGGGLANHGRLTVSGGAISGNAASDSGGGVFNGSSGNLTLADALVAGNSAAAGGGVFAAAYQQLQSAVIVRCALTGNTAVNGGGAYLAASKVYNSTASGNYASRQGGGVYGGGSFFNVTVFGNRAA